MFDNNDKLELGKKSDYTASYTKSKLFAIPRAEKRLEISIDPENLPFNGFDLWNHYEVSWLNLKGKPMVAVAKIIYSCNSPNIIESKSMKLYFNSFNNTKFLSVESVQEIIKKDLEQYVQHEVIVELVLLENINNQIIKKSFDGICIDNLDISCSRYQVHPEYLSILDSDDSEIVEEILYSDLLKSNCLVTNQPDWGSLQIIYKGKKISHQGLLKYIISFRNHNEFHEQCIERIFNDILTICKPLELTVLGNYTRRGGVDINPYRTTKKINLLSIESTRLYRQ